jgi:ferredoxin
MPTIRFAGLGVTVPASPDETVLDLCIAHDLPMEAACGGFAACNTCRIRLLEGELTPLDEIEEPFLETPGQRLGCQARIIGDATIRLEPGEV